jgi:hypothetical protein
MPSEREMLAEIRANILARLNEMTRDPKPDYAIDGERYAWGDLFEKYATEKRAIEDRLKELEREEAGADPFEFQTRGYT